ncbi:hypothetical protein [Algibacter luteus]|uniref:CarboxypepD_reg-like domain-containing protein n=1 Tax=Algibacter luteus TaxID=1178825 RepID=A0A1M6G9Y4_9FLAO|nr:hypothetical protein [Algibacter luteus]SHJ06738.1 hypothetical protein SAMN05216261_2689 [Algibacter luteus]
MRRVFFILGLIFWSISAFSQSTNLIDILGRVDSTSEIENIHVLNKTAQKFTITDRNGHFKIAVKLNDTLTFTSIQHFNKEVLVTKEILANRVVYVKLDEKINELDEVVIGKVLTGNLMSDIGNIEGEAPISFYDVGIPGYTGKPATQSERRLKEAGDFKPKMLLGVLTGGLPLNPILNGLSGRTKRLKNRVKLEEKEALIQSIKARLSKDFFASNPLEEDLKMDFFYFCADDANFLQHCKNNIDFKILIFLRMKYRQYLNNLDSSKN